MATESFDMALAIDSDEAVANFPNAVDSSDARGPLEIRDFSEELLLGVELIRERTRYMKFDFCRKNTYNHADIVNMPQTSITLRIDLEDDIYEQVV